MPALFVLPATTAGQQGPVASLLSTAGWASAAHRVVGTSWIVTPDGVVDVDEARHRGTAAHLASGTAPTWRRRVPTVVKTAAKDIRQRRRARQFSVDPEGPWRDQDLAFVWQRHEMFHTAGLTLARALDVPSVLFAPATLVWEARGWGVTRPGWARLLERTAERPAMTMADLVACGSDAVAEQAVRLGAHADRVIVTPTGVDLDLFGVDADPSALRRRLQLEGRFVVGWVGSFRPFHALEQLVDAVAGLPDVTLLLVGDGPERAGIERHARARGVSAVFPGTVEHVALPQHLAAMDVAVVLASAGGSFHYSPLKLAEYLASGRPVIAPAVPHLVDRLTHRTDALLVAPGRPEELAAAVRTLHDDPALRARMGTHARRTAGEGWSWDVQVRRVVDAVATRPLAGHGRLRP